jgi:hypothetical protein
MDLLSYCKGILAHLEKGYSSSNNSIQIKRQRISDMLRHNYIILEQVDTYMLQTKASTYRGHGPCR